MEWLVLIGTVIGGALVFLLRKLGGIWRSAANLAALVAYAIVVAVSGGKVIEIIVDDEVLMTTVHEIFLNELFLGGSAYLAVFGFSRLMESMGKRGK
ncbi:hypothetical protein ACFFSY_30300 [Paenibacillus aurantiacus]|uniref:Transposase n=1 Tax=Paenibacillus aurantiacus TaxID=1936118 RepID=A0ABV5KYG4_9BACL